jgi:uncharacterized protein involved in exopolysaccharide biosynthesis
VLQQPEILYPVIQNLKLIEAWAVEGRQLPLQVVYGKLLGMMKLREVRSTGLIEIGVYSTDAQEAANIANMIAVVYQEKRQSDLQADVDRGLAQLREEVEKQREKVDAAAAETAKIRAAEGIIDPDPEAFGSSLSMPDRQIVAIEQQVNAARLEVTQLQGELEQISKLRPEELKEALRTLKIDDPTVVKMVANLQDATSEEARLFSNGLGENHPRIKALRSQREVFNQQLAEQLNSVRQNHATKLSIAQRTLSQLEQNYQGAQSTQIQESSGVPVISTRRAGIFTRSAFTRRRR